MSKNPFTRPVTVGFLILLGLAFLTGIRGWDWGFPYYLHPEERRLIMSADDASPGGSPARELAIGPVPVYLLKGVRELGSVPLEGSLNGFVVGRILSILLGTGLVAAVFLLGRAVYNGPVGLLAAFLTLFSPVYIQQVRVYTGETVLALLVLLTVWFFISARRFGKRTAWALSGLCFGLALSTRFDASILIPVMFLSQMLFPDRDPEGETRNLTFRNLLQSPGQKIWSVSFLSSFLAVNPHLWWDWEGFQSNVFRQMADLWFSNLASLSLSYAEGNGTVDFLRNGFWWALGPVLSVPVLLGLTRLIRRGWDKSLDPREGVILLTAVSFGVAYGFLPDPRPGLYLIFLPYLCVAAAGFLARAVQIAEWASLRFVGWTAAMAASLLFVGNGISQHGVFTRTDPRVEASDWFYRTVPSGKTIASEFGATELPLTRNGGSPERFQRVKLFPREKPGTEKIDRLSEALNQADFLIVSGKTGLQTAFANREWFPFDVVFYKLLFQGGLGFQLEKSFSNSPEPWFGFPDEAWAHPAWTDFDRPRIWIFKKVEPYSKQNYADLLSIPEDRIHGPSFRQILSANSHRATGPKHPYPQPGGLNPLDPPTGKGSSLWQAVKWLIVVEVIGLLFFPVLFSLFTFLPDRGYSQTKTVGILFVGYLSWTLTRWGWFPFDRENVSAAILIFLLVGFWTFMGREEQIRDFVRSRWKILAQTEGVFLLVFLIFLGIRSFNPEIFWGEKPMDFSFLNVMNRTEGFPPPEPWFSGTPMNYYYLGFLLVWVVGKPALVPPEFAFNLALGLIPGLVGVSLFGLFRGIVDRFFAALFGVFLAIFSGNLAGIYEYWTTGRPFDFHYFWATSRVIPNTINEYPFWSFIFSDLHAHVMAMMFVPVVIALLYGVFLDPRGTLSYFRAPPRLLKWILPSLLLGAFAFTNSWDYPVYLFLFGLVLLAKYAWTKYSDGKTRCLAFGSDLVLPTAMVSGFSYLLYLPFHRAFHPQPIHVGRVLEGWAKPGEVFLIFGFFFAVFCVYALQKIYHRRLILFRRGGSPRSRIRAGIPVTLLFLSILAAAYFLSEVSIGRPYGGLAVFGGVLLFWIGLVAGGSQEGSERFLTLLVLPALLLGMFSEWYFVGDRMNTVFKFYLSGWFFLSVASLYFLHGMVQTSLGLSFEDMSARIRWWFPVGFRLLIGIGFAGGVLAILFCSVTAAYGLIQTNRVPTDKPTLNGMAYLSMTNPQEYGAIRWLNENIPGTPTLLEAQGPSYQDFSRITMNTGIPNLLGWEHHVYQRGKSRSEIEQRKEAVRLIYEGETWEDVAPFVRYYGIDYIYVGDLERRTYSPRGLAKFQSVLPLVFRNERVRIYSVPDGVREGVLP